MNDKTEQLMADTLRRVAKSAMPCGTAMIGAGHLSDAADTIDNLRAENESLREQRNRIGLCIGHALSGGRKDDHEAGLSGRMDAIRALIAERNERQASRIAYANEFPLNADGEPDVVNIHANIRSLKAQLAEAQKDAERWGWAVQCARLDQFGGFVVTPDEPAFASEVSLAFTREIDAAIDAAKGETS